MTAIIEFIFLIFVLIVLAMIVRRRPSHARPPFKTRFLAFTKRFVKAFVITGLIFWGTALVWLLMVR